MIVQAARSVADGGRPRGEAQNPLPFELRVSVQAICKAVTLVPLATSIECATALNRLGKAHIAIGLKGDLPMQLAAIIDRDLGCEADTVGEIATSSLSPKCGLCDTRSWQPCRRLGS